MIQNQTTIISAKEHPAYAVWGEGSGCLAEPCGGCLSYRCQEIRSLRRVGYIHQRCKGYPTFRVLIWKHVADSKQGIARVPHSGSLNAGDVAGIQMPMETQFSASPSSSTEAPSIACSCEPPRRFKVALAWEGAMICRQYGLRKQWENSVARFARCVVSWLSYRLVAKGKKERPSHVN
jgi:hypothetical protein